MKYNKRAATGITVRLNGQAFEALNDMIIPQPKNNLNSGVYEIVNTLNGHRYIGSSLNLNKRRNEHLRDLQKGKHHSQYLQRAWNKYGEKNFVFSVIEYCDKDLLISKEQNHINAVHPSYNISLTAGSPLGVKHSLETRKKVSEAGKGRVFSEEHKRRIGQSNKGKIRSEEAKIVMAKNSTGRIFSEESRRKMSESSKNRVHKMGYKLSEETKTKISKSLLGNKRTIGRDPWNKGKRGLYQASEETRVKMSLTRTGKKHSEEAKRHMSESKKRYWEEKRSAA